MQATVLRGAKANTPRVNLASTTTLINSYPKHKAQGGVDFRVGWLVAVLFQIFLWETRVILLGKKRACLGAFSRVSSKHSQTYTCKHGDTYTLHCLSAIMSSSSRRQPVEQSFHWACRESRNRNKYLNKYLKPHCLALIFKELTSKCLLLVCITMFHFLFSSLS